MKVVNDTGRQLASRRFLPVAIILVAAAVAVPLTLAKDPQPAQPQALKPVDESAAMATKTIVSPATPETSNRKVLGSKENPFRSEKLPEPKTVTAQSSVASGGSDEPGATSGPDGSIPSGGGGVTISPPSFPSAGAPPVSAPVAPAVERVEHERHSLTVRIGGDDALERMNIKRLEPLPLGEEPLVVYLGVADGGKSARFLVDSSVTADGDGKCVPDPNTCEEIHLREGETEFFDIMGEDGESAASYQLDLLEIHGGEKGTAARTAKAARAG